MAPKRNKDERRVLPSESEIAEGFPDKALEDGRAIDQDQSPAVSPDDTGGLPGGEG